MRIALSADHAGYELKDLLAAWLAEAGHEVIDLGTNGPESVDYPRYGAALAEALADGRAERGITVCGSGIGIAIAANRNPACRCAQVAEPLSATLARQHNDCNAIALGARLTIFSDAISSIWVCSRNSSAAIPAATAESASASLRVKKPSG